MTKEIKKQALRLLRHANRNELAWKKVDEVRYFLSTKECEGSPSVIEMKNGRFKKIIDSGKTSDYIYQIQWTLAEFMSDYFYFEVAAVDLPYLEKPDVEKYGETEFRKHERGEKAIGYVNGEKGRFEILNGVLQAAFNGSRWCAPRKQTCPHCNGTGEI